MRITHGFSAQAFPFATQYRRPWSVTFSTKAPFSFSPPHTEVPNFRASSTQRDNGRESGKLGLARNLDFASLVRSLNELDWLPGVRFREVVALVPVKNKINIETVRALRQRAVTLVVVFGGL